MKKMLLVVLLVLCVLSLTACDLGTKKDGCVFEDGVWKCNSYDAMMSERTTNQPSTVEKVQQAVEQLNQNVQDAAKNVEAPTAALETLDKVVDPWTDQEKAQDYQDARDTATNNELSCGHWNADSTQWISEPCQ